MTYLRTLHANVVTLNNTIPLHPWQLSTTDLILRKFAVLPLKRVDTKQHSNKSFCPCSFETHSKD